MHTPNIFTRIIYCFALLGLIKSVAIPHLHYAYKLVKKMFNSFTIVDPIVSVLFLLIGLAIIATVVHRIYEIIRGYVTLSSPDVSQFINGVRIIGIVCMYIGVICIASSSLFALFFGGNAQTLLKFFMPIMIVGLMLFEFTRMKSFEDDDMYYDYEEDEK